eukprot:2834511-Rhodomonas_salina.1
MGSFQVQNKAILLMQPAGDSQMTTMTGITIPFPRSRAVSPMVTTQSVFPQETARNSYSTLPAPRGQPPWIAADSTRIVFFRRSRMEATKRRNQMPNSTPSIILEKLY